MVYKFLRLEFGEQAFLYVTFDIDIEESGVSADAHRRAVLIFDRSEIAEIKPLNRFLRVFRGAGNIETVFQSHLFQRFQSLYLLRDFLSVANLIGNHIPVYKSFIFIFLCNQIVCAVKGDTPVIANDSASAVSVGQSGEDVRRARVAHFGRVNVEHPVVVRLSVFFIKIVNGRVDFITVNLEGLFSHSESAGNVQSALERFVRLKSDDFFDVLVDITGFVTVHRRNDFRVCRKNSARCAFFFGKVANFFPQFLRVFRCGGKETSVAFIRRVVALDKISYVNFVLAPLSGNEVCPL